MTYQELYEQIGKLTPKQRQMKVHTTSESNGFDTGADALRLEPQKQVKAAFIGNDADRIHPDHPMIVTE